MKLEYLVEKLLSRKFWVALAGAVALFLHDGLDLSNEATAASASIMGVYVVIEGIHDIVRQWRSAKTP